ncbi:MAG: hypothetical protein VX367_01985 [SAR324 cluster bacterium]|nr:hypothetical protein [SAR324 cluster bacterium]
MQKQLAIQKCDRWTDRQTDGPMDQQTNTSRCRVVCPRLKRGKIKKRRKKRNVNKAGYTAKTSCGRAGRSRHACFHMFRLVLTDRWTDGLTDRRTNG